MAAADRTVKEGSMDSSDFGKVREILASTSKVIGLGSISLDDVGHFKEVTD